MHELDQSDDPGPYVPTSGYTARLYDTTITAYGTPLPGAIARTVSDDPLVTTFDGPDNTPTAVVGLNAFVETRSYAASLGITPSAASVTPHGQ